MIPNDPKLVEAILLACVEPNPIAFKSADENDVLRVTAAIKRGTTPKGAKFREPVNRNPFLLGCHDFTETLPKEHLIVGYGCRSGSTTKVDSLHHVVGEDRSIQIPVYVREEIRRRHYRRTDGEIVIFHNHPRLGSEPDWLYTVKALIEDLPIASDADRRELQHHTLTPVALIRQFFGRGRILFYIGESGFVKQFLFPPLLPFLAQFRSTPA